MRIGPSAGVIPLDHHGAAEACGADGAAHDDPGGVRRRDAWIGFDTPASVSLQWRDRDEGARGTGDEVFLLAVPEPDEIQRRAAIREAVLPGWRNTHAWC